MNTNTCPSKFELAERESLGTLSTVSQHTETCSRCQSVLAELQVARNELLGFDPVLQSHRAAQNILAEVAVRRQRVWRRWTFWLPFAFAPAAAAMLFFASTAVPKADLLSQDSQTAVTGVRAKSSSLGMRVFCKRGDTQFEVADGGEFVKGDRLRFSYTKGERGHLTVFSVDDAANISAFYKDGELGSQPADVGTQVMLPGSVELDGHKGWERVFALWAPQPIDALAVRKAVDSALAKAGGDVRKITGLPLDNDQVSYLLRRP